MGRLIGRGMMFFLWGLILAFHLYQDEELIFAVFVIVCSVVMGIAIAEISTRDFEGVDRMKRYKFFKRYMVTISALVVVLTGIFSASITWYIVNNHDVTLSFLNRNKFVSLSIVISVLLGVLLLIDYIRYREGKDAE